MEFPFYSVWEWLLPPSTYYVFSCGRPFRDSTLKTPLKFLSHFSLGSDLIVKEGPGKSQPGSYLLLP